MQAAELLLVFLCGQLSTLHVSASLTPDHPPNVAASGPTGTDSTVHWHADACTLDSGVQPLLITT